MSQRFGHVSASALIMGLRDRRALNRTRLRPHSMRTDHAIRWSSVGAMILPGLKRLHV
jgi:hypothetical protein